MALLSTVLCLLAPALAEEVTNESCLACHGTEGFAGPDGRSLFVGADAFGASVHGSLPCTTCHVDATEVPHPKKPKRVAFPTCATCHEGAVTDYERSVHGQANALGFREAATCHDCHGNIHAVRPHTDPTAPTHWTNLAATCAHCHRNDALAEKFQIPVVRPVEAYLASVHARAVAAGERGAVCSDCHGSHLVLPGTDPRSSLWRTNVPETCGKCHKAILTAYEASVHGEAVARGVTEAPVCTDCHGEHRILGPAEPTSPVAASNIPRETCGRCHSDERLNRKYGIPMGQVRAFQDSYHGLALRSGRVVVANCASCHGVHDIRPSSDPRSSVYKANLPHTCGKCHPGAGTKFTLGSVHGTPTSINTQVVGWVRFIYLWLIGLTIGGMFFHNLLDLARKARHPEPHHPVAVQSEERMTRGLRWQHGLTMLSFPVLVYTGFALKYPEAWWAAPLLRWENGVPLRGIIHRIAAVVMVSGLVWHLGYVVANRRVRTCMRGLLPGLRDLWVVIGTFAYYLGWRATRPFSGRFNYAEKAEYWAFMWGSAVMTLTGFVLWFENTTLHYLPSWVPDVATALHFYEAILATLAILVWHFYWVIFDPEVYPMDWTWWTGRPPASRVIERTVDPEHPEQPPQTGSHAPQA